MGTLRRTPVPRSRYRCLLCPGSPWFYVDREPFAAWQAHYLGKHYQKPETA